MPKAMVAIVGRPNVGKSTLINRLASTGKAIVDAVSGVTRDRLYIETNWRGRDFVLIDTGGIEMETAQSMQQEIKEQALAAITEADLIIFVVDGKTGEVAGDADVAKILHRSRKPVLLVANKIDKPAETQARFIFYPLGLGEPNLISAMHGLGIGDLLDEIVSNLPPEQEHKATDAVNIAIVGRPNAGKSSILNHLMGEKRAIVSEVPGTTRDAIDSITERNGRRYRFIDTAGLRKTTKSAGVLEYYGTIRTIRALEEADIALHIVDAGVGVTTQDQRIAALIEEKHCAAITILNKWDLVDDESEEEVLAGLDRKLHFIGWSLLLKASALTGRGLKNLYEAIDEAMVGYQTRLSTNKLNQFLAHLRAAHLPSKGGKVLKLKYITQVRSEPPAFLFFVNDPKLVNNAYKRYLDKQFREQFGFIGTPLITYFRREN